MIRINLFDLEKATRTIHIKATPKRKAHTRVIKVPDRVENKNYGFIKDLKEKRESNIDYVKRCGWNIEDSTLFYSGFNDLVEAHLEDGKIHSLSITKKEGNSLSVMLLEVNPDMRRKGYGIKAMKDIANKAYSSGLNSVALNSMDENSDKFYDALGMKKEGSIIFTMYTGDKTWMKNLMNAK